MAARNGFGLVWPSLLRVIFLPSSSFYVLPSALLHAGELQPAIRTEDGRYDTKSCRAGRLSYRAIEAARRARIGQFHRTMSGQFRINGKIWVRVLADLPITGKPTEVRMGRGKGNPTGWIARVSTGQIPFETDDVSLSNVGQAATLAVRKLCSSTKFVQWS